MENERKDIIKARKSPIIPKEDMMREMMLPAVDIFNDFDAGVDKVAKLLSDVIDGNEQADVTEKLRAANMILRVFGAYNQAPERTDNEVVIRLRKVDEDTPKQIE